MVATGKENEAVPEASSNMESDRLRHLKAFDETKAGVKGLVDAGVTEIPRIFHIKTNDSANHSVPGDTKFTVPVIDLVGISGDKDRRKEIVERVRDASEKWGFFQIVNHGISEAVLEEMIRGVRRFHEQETEVKREFYHRDTTKKVVYNSNFDLYTGSSTNWRDTLFANMAPDPPNPQELPSVIRDILIEFSEKVMEIGIMLLEILSEALGLSPNHLKDMECAEGLVLLCNYYPPCPQPELTIGLTRHSDNDFITILLQDHISGLQILHDDNWIDMPTVPGALVVNIGDFLQLISNDKFKSVEHRAQVSRVGPRVSVACFFSTSLSPSTRLYGPIKELLSENDSPKYRETTIMEYTTYVYAQGLHGTLALDHFRL